MRIFNRGGKERGGGPPVVVAGGANGLHGGEQAVTREVGLASFLSSQIANGGISIADAEQEAGLQMGYDPARVDLVMAAIRARLGLPVPGVIVDASNVEQFSFDDLDTREMRRALADARRGIDDD